MLGRSLQAGVAALAATAGVALAQSNKQPVPLPWNTDGGYGPDGPWNYLKLNVGSSSVDFYPIFGLDDSIVIRSDVCGTPNGARCLSPTPRYYQSASPSAIKSNQGLNQTTQALGSYFRGQATSGSGYVWTDTVSATGISSDSTALFVSPSIMQAHGKKSWVPVSLLSMEPSTSSIDPFDMPVVPSGTRSNTLLQTYVGDGGSTSMSLHMGAAGFKQGGSLILGGYDQGRLINQPTSVSVLGSMSLVNISIGTSGGLSPFGSNAASLPSNFLTNGSVDVLLSPHVSTLQVPQAICDLLGRYIPLKTDDDTGLSLWDTSSSLYRDLISSPSYLAFTFRGDGNINSTIRVPFAALNLNLTEPIKSSPTPYFPCEGRPAGDEIGNKAARYNLGRAFLQSAFLLQSWAGPNGGRDGVYVGQAPGPNFTAKSMMPSSLSNNNFIVRPLDNAPTWEETWGTVLKPLSVLGATVSSDSSATQNSSGLTGGTIAGVVVGVLVGISFFAGLIFALILVRRRAAKKSKQNRTMEQGGSSAYGGHQNPPFVQEIDSKVSRMPPQEMDSAHHWHEMRVSGSSSTHEMGDTSGPMEMPTEFPRR